MREALAALLTTSSGFEVNVTRMERITVGHSRAMYRVDCASPTGVPVGPFVLRMEQGGVFGTSSAEEFGVMRSLASAGVPLARVLWSEPTGDVLGRPFFVMDYLQGADPANERAMDRASADSFIRELKKLHELDGTGLAIPFAVRPASPGDATHLQIDRWAATYRAAAPVCIPLLEEAEAWLHAFAPPLDRLAVVHGDAGPGNVVMAEGGVVAFTDFEFTHLGDPAEDWAFCVTMRGARTMTRGEWTDLLGRHGVVLSAWEWTYWEAFNLFKGACANRTCLQLFENGANRAPNMAIIGTTLHQVFLRRLAGIVGANPVPPPDRSAMSVPDRGASAR